MSKPTDGFFDAVYITVPEMAIESGQSLSQVYNWLRYHNYLAYERVNGRTVVRRSNWEDFKTENPDLMQRGAE